ncbi:MAG: hypothetical protein KatS3mg023_3144 [Armatimonadota bacterium]|nr:MAG: hypothetical protein KatS3mg023_3144 [Armatimonadota bacterium]
MSRVTIRHIWWVSLPKQKEGHALRDPLAKDIWNYARRRRRASSPTTPLPSTSRLAGSGTGTVSR